jgi:hypothetical protein
LAYSTKNSRFSVAKPEAKAAGLHQGQTGVIETFEEAIACPRHRAGQPDSLRAEVPPIALIAKGGEMQPLLPGRGDDATNFN